MPEDVAIKTRICCKGQAKERKAFFQTKMLPCKYVRLHILVLTLCEGLAHNNDNHVRRRQRILSETQRRRLWFLSSWAHHTMPCLELAQWRSPEGEGWHLGEIYNIKKKNSSSAPQEFCFQRLSKRQWNHDGIRNLSTLRGQFRTVLNTLAIIVLSFRCTSVYNKKNIELLPLQRRDINFYLGRWSPGKNRENQTVTFIVASKFSLLKIYGICQKLMVDTCFWCIVPNR